ITLNAYNKTINNPITAILQLCYKSNVVIWERENELEIEEIRVRVVLSRFKYFPSDQD
ncbi:21100_t:CDS:2, partial [Cetraspora pellucida]